MRLWRSKIHSSHLLMRACQQIFFQWDYLHAKRNSYEEVEKCNEGKAYCRYQLYRCRNQCIRGDKKDETDL